MDTELDRLVPDVTPLKLSTGFEVSVVRMKTRQFFRLLKVITHGAGPRLVEMSFDFEAEPEVFAARLATLVAMSIPDAETETLAFLDSMGEPAGLAAGEASGRQASDLTKAEKESDAELWRRYHAELFNPDPMDTLEMVEAIVRRESEDVQALGKRFAALLKLAQRTGQDQPGEPEETPTGSDLHPSPAPSPAPSTSSAPSTGGQTQTSSPSPSAGSGKPPKQHQIAVAPSS